MVVRKLKTTLRDFVVDKLLSKLRSDERGVWEIAKVILEGEVASNGFAVQEDRGHRIGETFSGSWH